MKHCLALAVCALLSVEARSQVATEWFKLTLDDPAVGDFFGSAISVSDKYIAVGVPRRRHSGAAVGVVYVYDLATREIRQVLYAEDGQEFVEFGNAVSVFGDRVVVGARAHDGAYEKSGAAYVFDALTGQQIFMLVPSDPAPSHQFGRSVALSDRYVVVGAYGDGHAGDYSGAAYVFDLESGIQRGKLVAEDAMKGDQFGVSVAVSGNLAAIGSYLDDQGDVRSTGSMYIFDIEKGRQISKCVADDAASGDLLGNDVDIHGSLAIAGAQLRDDVGINSGAAYVFEVMTGQQVFKLVASDVAALDSFGRDVAINDSVAIVGSISDDDLGFQSGSAYFFDLQSGQQLSKLLASDGSGQNSLGEEVAISGTVALVATPQHNSGAGAVYLYSLPFMDCLPDTNNDGALTPADFSAWVAAFNASAPACDQNGDGLCTPADFSAWVANYNAGCS